MLWFAFGIIVGFVISVYRAEIVDFVWSKLLRRS